MEKLINYPNSKSYKKKKKKKKETNQQTKKTLRSVALNNSVKEGIM